MERMEITVYPIPIAGIDNDTKCVVRENYDNAFYGVGPNVYCGRWAYMGEKVLRYNWYMNDSVPYSGFFNLPHLSIKNHKQIYAGSGYRR